MPLSPATLAALHADLAAATNRWLVMGMLTAGPGAYDKETLRFLIASGLLTEETATALQAGELPDLMHDAFTTGLLISRIAEAGEDARDWTPKQWTDEIKRRPIALTKKERAILDAARGDVGRYIQGLGDSVNERIGSVINEALDEERQHAIVGDDARRKESLEAIQTAVEAGVEGRKSTQWIASQILDATDDGARGLLRIAETEAHNVHERGTAVDIADRHGAEALVFKRLSRDACPSCQRLYLADDGNPRVFTLRALIANGTNFGRKQKDWQPTLDAAHPWCSCKLTHLPEGYGFDEEGQLVKVADRPGDAAESSSDATESGDERPEA